jgi:hypothetical protein
MEFYALPRFGPKEGEYLLAFLKKRRNKEKAQGC